LARLCRRIGIGLELGKVCTAATAQQCGEDQQYKRSIWNTADNSIGHGLPHKTTALVLRDMRQRINRTTLILVQDFATDNDRRTPSIGSATADTEPPVRWCERNIAYQRC
jgi:hypothetical protein